MACRVSCSVITAMAPLSPSLGTLTGYGGRADTADAHAGLDL